MEIHGNAGIISTFYERKWMGAKPIEWSKSRKKGWEIFW